MLENVGHTIQKIINNTPIAVATNATATAVATSGGDVYLSGFINNNIQACFEDINFNNDFVGKIIDVKAAEKRLYLLNDAGYVFEYNYHADDCGKFREIYSPRDCCGDKAIKISAGRDHILIVTNKNRVFGAGDNSEYQLVPQGQARYECAVEIIITDTNIHDDCCCDKFSGFINQNTTVTPVRQCSKPVCISGNANCLPIVNLVITGVSYLPPAIGALPIAGTLSIPILADYSYSGIGCIQNAVNSLCAPNGTITGSLTLSINRLYLANCFCPAPTINGAPCSLPATANLATFIPTVGGAAVQIPIQTGGTNLFDFLAPGQVLDPIVVPIPSGTSNVGNAPINVPITIPQSAIAQISAAIGLSATGIPNILANAVSVLPVGAIVGTGVTADPTDPGSFFTAGTVAFPGTCTVGTTTAVSTTTGALVAVPVGTPVATCANASLSLTNPTPIQTGISIIPTNGGSFSLLSCAAGITSFADFNGDGVPTADEIFCVSAYPTATLASSAVSSVFVQVSVANCNDDCCGKKLSDCCPISQPCWRSVYAGFDISVLVDTCNRLYVLGSLHKVRNNRHLMKKNCLESLLEKTNATITMPADELNCCVRPNNNNCGCQKCKQKCFKTDLSRFGVQLSFANGYCYEDNDCGDCDGTTVRQLPNRTNVCDFLKALQNCNEIPNCENTCEPCDNAIYLNVCGDCGCSCGNDVITNIGTITLFNKRSVSRFIGAVSPTTTGVIGACPVASLAANSVNVSVGVNSHIEFTQNTYCIDACDYPLDAVIVLNLNNTGTTNVNLYVDTCRMGTIKLTSCNDNCYNYDNYSSDPYDNYSGKSNRRFNVDFPVNINAAAGTSPQFAMNYGRVMDPVELANFRLALGLGCGFYSPCYMNPAPNRLYNAYLKGGDRVRFVLTGVPFPTPTPTPLPTIAPIANTSCGVNALQIRFPVTADIPTVFNMKRRVLDVAVGDNNLSVLVGGVACPNEVLAIGQNCYGELGINSNESIVCFKKVNRCLFDCQVERIFAGRHVTFYVTQSYRVYSSGSWKCVGNSNIPVCVPFICQGWKIVEISIAKNHIVLLSKDGAIYGFGDNSLGELGLCHTKCVKKPLPLTFLDRMNQCFVNKFKDAYKHPVLKFQDKYVDKTQSCTPCEPFCDREENDCYKPKYKYYEEERDVKYVKYGNKRKYVANDRCCKKC